MIDFNRETFYDASQEEYEAEVASARRCGRDTFIPTPEAIAAGQAELKRIALGQPVSSGKRAAATRELNREGK